MRCFDYFDVKNKPKPRFNWWIYYARFTIDSLFI